MIPDYQTIMLPLLRLVSDKQEYKYRDLIEKLAIEFKLTDEERKEWEELTKEGARLDTAFRRMKARGELFWTNLEERCGQIGKTLKIEENHLYLRKEKTIKELQNEEEVQHDPTDI